MADLTISPTNVTLESGGTPMIVTYGEAVVAGEVVYKKQADSKWWLAQCDVDAESAGSLGLGLCVLGGAADGFGIIVKRGTNVGLGQTFTKTDRFVLSTTPGGVAPHADLVSTNFLSDIGYAVDTDNMELELKATGTVQ